MAAMASAGHQVWVGFIKDLPVVGSVKEAVEWVLAVAADDFGLAKLKITAINGRIAKKDEPSQSSSGYGSDTSISPGSSPVKSARHDTKYELKSVPDVDLKACIIEAVGKGKKNQQTGNPLVKSKTDTKKLQEIQDTTLRKIQRIYPDLVFIDPLADDGRRSRRGEHVINNDVISFNHNVVDDFMKETYHMPNTLGIESPLDNDTRAAIQNELVVHFDEDEMYINANALIYGLYSLGLKQALTDWLAAPSQEVVKDVNIIVQIMNEEEGYVDWLARDKYIGKQKSRQDHFETIRGRVATMFTKWWQYFQGAKTEIDYIFDKSQ